MHGLVLSCWVWTVCKGLQVSLDDEIWCYDVSAVATLQLYTTYMSYRRVIVMKTFMVPFSRDSPTTSCTQEDTEELASEFLSILKERFFCTACLVIYVAATYLELHYSLLSVHFHTRFVLSASLAVVHARWCNNSIRQYRHIDRDPYRCLFISHVFAYDYCTMITSTLNKIENILKHLKILMNGKFFRILRVLKICF